LTGTAPCAFFADVPRFRFIFALLLATLWLPATLHCQIEAAGLEIIFVCHDHDHDTAHDQVVPVSSADHCAEDACHTLEGVALKAFAPAKLVGDATLFVMALLPAPPGTPTSGVSPERSDAPQELSRCWQFTTRAAPPSRAPTASV